MTKIQCETFVAKATIGLQKGYSNELILMTDFHKTLLECQKKIFDKYKIVLSTKVSQCEIICLGQQEASVTMEWIQYPKFPVPVEKLKTSIIELVEHMMSMLEQNRVVIIFQDETLMLEQNKDIDPAIIL